MDVGLDFGRLLVRFWMDFGRVWGPSWSPNRLKIDENQYGNVIESLIEKVGGGSGSDTQSLKSRNQPPRTGPGTGQGPSNTPTYIYIYIYIYT